MGRVVLSLGNLCVLKTVSVLVLLNAPLVNQGVTWLVSSVRGRFLREAQSTLRGCGACEVLAALSVHLSRHSGSSWVVSSRLRRLL